MIVSQTWFHNLIYRSVVCSSIHVSGEYIFNVMLLILSKHGERSGCTAETDSSLNPSSDNDCADWLQVCKVVAFVSVYFDCFIAR